MRTRAAFTLIELIVVLALVAITVGISALALRPFANELSGADQIVSGAFKQARAKAMATTSAFRFVFRSTTELEVESAVGCADVGGWTVAPGFEVELPAGTMITSPVVLPDTVLVCFNSRGFASQNLLLTIQDNDGRSRTIEVFLGGAVEVQ